MLDSNSNYILRGKTGWGFEDKKDIGWLVGWVEKEGNAYFYATGVETDKENPKFGEARRKITENILKELGIIK